MSDDQDEKKATPEVAFVSDENLVSVGLSLIILDVFDGSVKLGLEVTIVIFAEHYLVRYVADAFKHFAVNLSLER